MTTMDLLMIPGMSGSKRVLRMEKESRKRMHEAARSQMIAAAIMSGRMNSSRSKEKS